MEVDPRVVEAALHVQKAGLELIAALRNALDVAEDLLIDPQRATGGGAGVVHEPVQRIFLDD